MIVAPFFKGDGDMEVASKQHDVYGQALWIIVSKCHRYTEFARSLLNDADHPEWGARLSISITEFFNTVTTFWLRFGASGMTFNSPCFRS